MLWRLAAAFLLTGTLSNAAEVTLDANKSRSALRDESLLVALDNDAAPQDYVAAARADYRRLLTVLYARGYYAGTVSITVDGAEAANIAPLAAPDSIGEIVITVDAGPRFRFGEVAITPLPSGYPLPETLDPGERALSAELQGAVGDTISAWRDIGYAKASVADQSIVARHVTVTLDADVTLEPGPRLRFGPLTVSGAEDVTDARVRQIAGLPVGAVFDPAELRRVASRLR
ncbi:MAG: outer membrane protein assembly factor, partial [Pseudomonadota bacterium]